MAGFYHEYDPDIEVSLFEQLLAEYADLSAAAIAETLRRAEAVVDLRSGGNLYSRSWIRVAARDYLDLLVVRKHAAQERVERASSTPSAAPSAGQRGPADGAADPEAAS